MKCVNDTKLKVEERKSLIWKRNIVGVQISRNESTVLQVNRQGNDIFHLNHLESTSKLINVMPSCQPCSFRKAI